MPAPVLTEELPQLCLRYLLPSGIVSTSETLKLRTVRLLVWKRASTQIPLDTKRRVNDKVNGIAGSTPFYRFRLVSVLLKI